VNELPTWAEYLQALSIAVLALIGAFIAYQQWRTAHNRLRLDLFDRRFTVYVEALNFIGAVMQEGYPPSERYRPFARARDRAQYLFGPEVEILLERMHKTAAVLRATHSQIQQSEGAEKDEAIEEAIKTNRAALERFSEFDGELMSLMQPYLGFDTIRGKTSRGKVIEGILAFAITALLLLAFFYHDTIMAALKALADRISLTVS
jgi:hypothetical protein